MINKSELAFAIIGLTQFKLLRQKVKINKSKQIPFEISNVYSLEHL